MNTTSERGAHRAAWLPPPPPDGLPLDPFAADERARRAALEELADLIADLERWRRRQSMRRPAPGPRWLFVRADDGATLRIRFEDGRPVQLRTSAADLSAAVALASAAVDAPLRVRGEWTRDRRALDWRAQVQVAQ